MTAIITHNQITIKPRTGHFYLIIKLSNNLFANLGKGMPETPQDILWGGWSNFTVWKLFFLLAILVICDDFVENKNESNVSLVSKDKPV